MHSFLNTVSLKKKSTVTAKAAATKTQIQNTWLDTCKSDQQAICVCVVTAAVIAEHSCFAVTVFEKLTKTQIILKTEKPLHPNTKLTIGMAMM